MTLSCPGSYWARLGSPLSGGSICARQAPRALPPELLDSEGKPDPFLEAIASQRASLAHQAGAEIESHTRATMNAIANDEALQAMGRLKAFAKKNGLDKDLIDLRFAIESYPKMSQEPGWDANNEMGIESPVTIEVPQGWGVQFGSEGTQYAVQVTKAESRAITVAIVENGEEMFAVESFNNLDSGEVVAFKRRGAWATMLLTLTSRRKAAATKSNSEWYAKEARRDVKRFEE